MVDKDGRTKLRLFVKVRPGSKYVNDKQMRDDASLAFSLQDQSFHAVPNTTNVLVLDIKMAIQVAA